MVSNMVSYMVLNIVSNMVSETMTNTVYNMVSSTMSDMVSNIMSDMVFNRTSERYWCTIGALSAHFCHAKGSSSAHYRIINRIITEDIFT